MRAEAILDAGVGIALLKVSDAALTIRDLNDAFGKLTRYTIDDLVNQRADLLTGPRTDPHLLAAMAAAARDGEHWSGVLVLKDGTGAPLPVTMILKPIDWGGLANRAVMVTILDATALLRAQNVQRLSNDITVILGRRDEEADHAHDLAHAMVRDFADWCAIHLEGDDGSLDLVAIASRTGKAASASGNLVSPHLGIGKVFASGIPLLHQPSHPENPSIARQMQEIIGDPVRSVACMPIASNALETFGTITWAITDDQRAYHHEDIQAAEEVGIKFGHFLEEQRIRESLGHAIRAREGFMRAAGHELRTPLVSIKGYTQLLLRDFRRQTISPQRLESGLLAIESSTTRLSDLMEDLFTLTNPDLNTLPLRLTTVDIGSIVSEFLATTPSITTAGHQLSLTLPDEPQTVRIDTTRFLQVLFNIVINAVHFSPPDTEVTIEVWNEGDSVIISVADRGKGLAPGEEISIFDPFTLARSWHSSDQQGLGIGLHISKQIVNRHGGEIWAESDGPDQGTTFFIRLPLADDPRP